ncbi:MAG TPA: GntR family transcriptional regulator [Solirubrobacteraceae bacterium]|nr:GntR family transcriptional regulator [Solirubrobacteraceae bacterium]
MVEQPVDKPVGDVEPRLGDIAIDRDAEVPIGVQLAWALRSRIGDGRLQPGERLPGLRDLAEATGVNVNTVRAVYQRLEHEGLIDSQQGSGTFVVPTPRQPSAVGTIVANAAREARETGVDPREVAAALYVSLESAAGPTDEDAERRRLLRAQIAALERALGEMEAAHPGVAPPPPRPRPRPGIGPRLLSAEELEQVRSLLVRRLSIIQAAIDGATSALATGEGEAAPTARPRPQSAKADANAAPAAKRATRPPRGTRPAPAGT